MNDPATVADISAAMNLSVEAPSVPEGGDLERRVRRLEEEITALKDTKALEERVAQRVTERLQKATDASQFTATPPPFAAGRAGPFLEEQAAPTARDRPGWLLVDMIADARLMWRMLFDKRYAQAWTTHLVVWLFIPAILTSRWWFPLAYIPFFGPFLDKALDLLLAFCVYKALSRETRRYREKLEQRR
jgi:hypothetical protein